DQESCAIHGKPVRERGGPGIGKGAERYSLGSAVAWSPVDASRSAAANYGVSFFQQFQLVLNALDNRAAQNHVNRLCLTAEVPLIESGTAGYNGQVELIKRGQTQCYECTPKAAKKSFPGCTIRNTPSEPIHCIVWAEHLFKCSICCCKSLPILTSGQDGGHRDTLQVWVADQLTGWLEAVIRLCGDVIVLQVLLPVEHDRLGFHFPVLDVDFVAVQHDRDVFASHRIPLPVGDFTSNMIMAHCPWMQ
ncbi:hypothetical protein pipiens_019388, partial [Culex pipiens pipiens]